MVAQTPILEVDGLRVRCGALEAVKGISLTLGQGRIGACIGANGAGKTTFLKAIAGLLKPAAGSIRLDGQPITGQPVHAVVRRGLVLVPEGRRIFADQTVLDNLRLGAVSRRASASEVRAEAEALIEGSPLLRGKAYQPAGVLSGGEQQALAIARGQMAHPRVLLLDEPSLGLAPQAVEAIFETIVGLADRGATILLVEQLATLALEVADDAWVFERGVIRARGSGAELAASAEVSASYLGARSGPGGRQAPSPTETVRTPGGPAAASHGLPPGGARV